VYVAFVTPSFIRHPAFPFHLLTHLWFVHNFTYDTQGSLNGVNWTIATEVQFYLLLGVILPIIVRTKPLVILLVAVTVAWLYRYAAFYYVDNGELRTSHLFVLTSNVPGAADLFGWGIALCLVMRSELYAQLARWRWFPLATTSAAGIVFAIALNVFWPRAQYWPDVRMVTCFPTLLGFAFCLVVLAACQVRNAVTIRFLSSLIYLGTISYGIYLWHLTCIELLKKVPGIPPIWILLFTLGGTLGLSAISWHFMELPLIKFGRAPRAAASTRNKQGAPGKIPGLPAQNSSASPELV
jgi:peptidoglycan/LPS O-acetylase OafA/YrhL